MPAPAATLLVGLLLVACAATAGMAVWTWQVNQEAQALRSELSQLQTELTARDDLLRTLGDRADALEGRVTDLEGKAVANRVMQLEASLEAVQSEAVHLAQELDALRATSSEIETQMQTLQAAASGGLGDFRGGQLPELVRLTVPRSRQQHTLSCEAAAASMVARYHGVELTEADVLKDLPRNEDPNLGFRGNIDGAPGGVQDYGVYAQPIVAVLAKRGLRASAVSGGLDGIRASIAHGNPVIAWVTYDLKVSAPVTTTANGEPISLIPYQHVVAVTGYDSEGVWANDPWDGQEDYYPNTDLLRAMGYFGDMAIEVAAP
jgi:uncharacterized protein YvpB/prefoldin subunit 5